MIAKESDFLPGDFVVGWAGPDDVAIMQWFIVAISSMYDGNDCWYTAFHNGMFYDVLYSKDGLYHVLRCT